MDLPDEFFMAPRGSTRRESRTRTTHHRFVLDALNCTVPSSNIAAVSLESSLVRQGSQRQRALALRSHVLPGAEGRAMGHQNSPLPDPRTLSEDNMEEFQRQKRRHVAFKTALCESIRVEDGTVVQVRECVYGAECTFAHHIDELRPPPVRGNRHPKYKTMLCDKFSTTGFCKYGERCQFIHRLCNEDLLTQRRICGIPEKENLKPNEMYWAIKKMRQDSSFVETTQDHRQPLDGTHNSSVLDTAMLDQSVLNPTLDRRQPQTVFENFNDEHSFSGLSRGFENLNLSMPALPSDRSMISGSKTLSRRAQKKVFPLMGREFQSYYAHFAPDNVDGGQWATPPRRVLGNK